MSEEQQSQTYQEEEGISLGELFSILKNHLLACFLGFVIVVAIGVGYLYTTVPQYESTATILVDPIKASSNIDSLFSSDGSSSKKIATEAELLSSSSNVSHALAMLDLSSYHTVKDNLPYSDIKVYGGAGAVSAIKMKLTVTTVKDTNLVKISLTNESPAFAHDFIAALCTSYNTTLTEIARNSKSAQREFIENQIPKNDEELKKATDALGNFRKDSDIIQLSDKTSLLVSETVFYQMKIEPLQMEMNEAKVGIEQYQKDWTASGRAPLKGLDEVSSDAPVKDSLDKLRNLQQELTMYEAVSSLNMGGTATTGGTGTVIGINSKTISQTTQTASRQSDLNNSISQVRKDLLSRVTDLVGKKSSDNYEQSITKYLVADVLVGVYGEREAVYNNELAKLPDLQTKQADLEREVQVYESLGLKLREMLEETRLVEASVNRNVTVIDEASVPRKPVSPNKLLILAVSMLLGLAIGVLLALFLNSQDDSIKNVAMLKAISGKIPFLSWIPYFATDKKSDCPSLVVYNKPLSFEAERFKLVANLLDKDISSGYILSVTSCSMSEGKSTVIANVAVALSQMGKKVLLVDGDLRVPSMMKYFNLEAKGQPGLVDWIVHNKPLGQCIVEPLSNLKTLHLLPAGSSPLVPSAIYTNIKYRKLLEMLRGMYEFIIIDAPPLDYASELIPLCKCTDGLLITVRAGITTKTGFHSLVENLETADIPILGTILNACGSSALEGVGGKAGTSRYGYGYGYGYGNSYSSSGKKGGKRRKPHSHRWYRKQYRIAVAARNSKGKIIRKSPTLAYPNGIGGGVSTVVPHATPEEHLGVSETSAMDFLSQLENDSASTGKKDDGK